MVGPTWATISRYWLTGSTSTSLNHKGIDMKSRWARRSARLCLGAAWSLLFAILFAASDDPVDDSSKANLTFRLPADAVLEIQNKKIEGSGESRRESIAVAAEGETVIAVKASWMECDT